MPQCNGNTMVIQLYIYLCVWCGIVKMLRLKINVLLWNKAPLNSTWFGILKQTTNFGWQFRSFTAATPQRVTPHVWACDCVLICYTWYALSRVFINNFRQFCRVLVVINCIAAVHRKAKTSWYCGTSRSKMFLPVLTNFHLCNRKIVPIWTGYL